jgi:hypothetical protein
MASVSLAQDSDFQKLGPILHEFRTTAGNELAIRTTNDSFQVLHRVEAALSADDAKQLLPKEPSFPTLKISQEGNWIEHTIDQDTRIEEPLAANGSPDSSRQWKKVSWVAVGVFARDTWPRFVEFALENGLCGIEETRYKDSFFFAFAFSPIVPDQIDVGGRMLALDGRFASLMRLSPKYPPRAGDKGS